MMLHSILFTQILKIIACYLINNTELIDIFVVCRLWIIRGIKIRSSWLYNPLPVGNAGFVQRAGGKRARW
ncbi:hypothetical protein, partial [Escherichia coli]|uniref:hypothetical protein n=1 Tax=Escherichia coli TaxID=562 RepID=UPI00193C84AB